MREINKYTTAEALNLQLGQNGFDVVAPEGFVAIDNNLGGAVKLVDRMEFSFNNFTAAKAWDK